MELPILIYHDGRQKSDWLARPTLQLATAKWKVISSLGVFGD